MCLVHWLCRVTSAVWALWPTLKGFARAKWQPRHVQFKTISWSDDLILKCLGVVSETDRSVSDSNIYFCVYYTEYYAWPVNEVLYLANPEVKVSVSIPLGTD